MFAAKNKVEYEEEMIDPSGTVDPAKLTDEIWDVSPSDSLETPAKTSPPLRTHTEEFRLFAILLQKLSPWKHGTHAV